MGKVWNVAVVGCGIGRSHIAEGYAKNNDKFRVFALCDLDQSRLTAVGDEFQIAHRTTSFSDLLQMDDVEIVDLCTPPTLHLDQCLQALAAGKHVICEKPVAGSLADVDALIAAEARAKTRLMPIFQYRYGNGVQKAKYLIDAGIAGKPYLAIVETAWRRTPAYYDRPWRGRWATELGGVLLTQAIHAHDLLTWLLGPVSSVFARTATRVNPIEVEDCAAATLVMESGAIASLAATLGAQTEVSRLKLCFENLTFESSPEPYAPGNDPWHIVPSSPQTEERIADLLKDWSFVPSRFEGLMADYHAALESGRELPVTLADARRSIELATALYHSAKSGDAVRLPVTPTHQNYHGWLPGTGG